MSNLINNIYNIDARNLLSVLEDKIIVKSTITSPPYFDMKDYGADNQIGFGQTYNDYLNDLQLIFKEIYKITSDDGSLWIVIDTFKRNNQVVTLPFDLSNKLKEDGWLLQDIIIWKKDKTVPWSKNGFVQRKFEYILFFTKSNSFKYNRDKVRNFDTNQLKKWWVKYPERYNPKGKALDEIWEFPIPVQGSWGDKYIRHFCPLPKEMVARMIEISTDSDDLVLDPFAGSGSVLCQASIMERKYIGFELNPDYINMFTQYLKGNKEKLRKEYLQSLQLSSQEEFRKKILDLRSLKFGRLLVNSIKKHTGFDLKVFVDIIKYLDHDNKHIKVEYQLIGDITNDKKIAEHIDLIIRKAPLSKFGIEPIFSFLESKVLENKDYYYYTSTNSYSYSDLLADSPRVKVISRICVNLNEDDYS